MTALHEQMQEKMNQIFTERRIDALIQDTKAVMIYCAKDIEKCPAVDGGSALQEVNKNDVIVANKDESTTTMIGIAMPIPGLNEIQQAAATVVEDRISNRKATRERPQDKKVYTEKQKIQFLQRLQKQLKIFRQAEAKLQELQILKHYEYDTVFVDTKNDRLIPVKGVSTPKNKMAISKQDLDQELERVTGFPHATANTPNRPKPLSA